MSFSSAYFSLKNGKPSSKPKRNFRDPTPEEWKNTMDKYISEQMKNQNQYSKSWGRRK